ncbi:hypothetical protein GCM10007386_43190 [Pseudoduganella dura]|nr:hypothetical protein GCM10007386_43190 [Pseudoduganella dura]
MHRYAAQDAVRIRYYTDIADMPGGCKARMIGDEAMGRHGAARIARRQSTGEAAGMQWTAAWNIVEHLRQHYRAMRCQHGQPGVAAGISRFFLENIERDATRTVLEQDFNQVGQLGAGPWPGLLGEAAFVDVHDQDAVFRLIPRTELDKAIAQPLTAQVQWLRRVAELRPSPDNRHGSGYQAAQHKRGSRIGTGESR